MNNNTGISSRNFNSQEIQIIWQKGLEVEKNDPKEWRKDFCGNLMMFDELNNRESQYGWEIAYITPLGEGGKDDISNFRPLLWKANISNGKSNPWNEIFPVNAQA